MIFKKKVKEERNNNIRRKKIISLKIKTNKQKQNKTKQKQKHVYTSIFCDLAIYSPTLLPFIPNSILINNQINSVFIYTL